jgi:hypothetical protein
MPTVLLLLEQLDSLSRLDSLDRLVEDVVARVVVVDSLARLLVRPLFLLLS